MRHQSNLFHPLSATTQQRQRQQHSFVTATDGAYACACVCASVCISEICCHRRTKQQRRAVAFVLQRQPLSLAATKSAYSSRVAAVHRQLCSKLSPVMTMYVCGSSTGAGNRTKTTFLHPMVQSKHIGGPHTRYTKHTQLIIQQQNQYYSSSTLYMSLEPLCSPFSTFDGPRIISQPHPEGEACTV